MIDFTGIIAVPPTPFTEDGKLDIPSLRRYVKNALSQGAKGFLAPAVAGEVESLEHKEREQIVKTLVSESGDSALVIGGVTDPDPAARIRHTKAFLDLGCGGILSYFPFEGDEKAVIESTESIAKLEPSLLMIQDLDHNGRSLPVSLISRLHKDYPVFSWIKIETHDRGRKISQVIDIVGNTIRVGTAGADMIEMLERGAHAYLVSYTTATYTHIWNLHSRGQSAEAMIHYRKLLPCLAFMATHQTIQWRFTKALLKEEGIFATTYVRRNVPELDPVERKLIDELSKYATTLNESSRTLLQQD